MALAVLALLAGCGDLPRPFAGHPGIVGARLAQPPPARLAVPPPTNALLTDAAGAAYEQALVAALQDQEVPAVADLARAGDWRLTITADVRGDKVVPTFTVLDPRGAAKGTTEGAAVDAGQWADGNKPVLQAAAAAGAPAIAALLTRIEASIRLSDPNSLVNRPARVAVPEVIGAPGDGDHQLARNLRQQLPQIGETVVDAAAGADFVVQGHVTAVPLPTGTERIEIEWVITDAQGREAGHIVQLNEVAAGSLDHYWGDTALAVAQQTAGGVREVIVNQLGLKADAKAAAAATPTAPDATAAMAAPK